MVLERLSVAGSREATDWFKLQLGNDVCAMLPLYICQLLAPCLGRLHCDVRDCILLENSWTARMALSFPAKFDPYRFRCVWQRSLRPLLCESSVVRRQRSMLCSYRSEVKPAFSGVQSAVQVATMFRYQKLRGCNVQHCLM